jgi:uncharacterized membrane protein YphA (DoxX/SURF4 family)
MTNLTSEPVSKFLYKESIAYLLTIIRILIGWHFLYEGIVKLLSPSWSAGTYLLEATWLFSGIFKAMALNHTLLHIVNFLNTWGLILIGAGLFLGLFTRIACWSGAGLLLLYYMAHPPFTGIMEGTAAEGSYIWINKNLIEMFMLILLGSLPNLWMLGTDNLIARWRENKNPGPDKTERSEGVEKTENSVFNEPHALDRRMVIKNLITIPFLGGFVYAVLKNYGYETGEENNVKLEKQVDAISSASTKFKTFESLSELKEKVPKGKIRNLEISRLICGGNLLSGIAHSRDLFYVDGLMKKYFTSEKVWETFRLCEACGINSALVRTDTNTVQLIHKYWKMGGKIQWLAQTKTQPKDEEITINAQIAIDNGASAIYIQGNNADTWVYEGKFDLFDKWFSRFQGKGIPIGVGAHELDVVKAMEEKGYPVDFYMKTIHDHNYWSFQADEPKIRTVANNNDNYWCREPKETAAFMETVNKPWIGFKILAAGAIRPEHGFKYAFESGADFACVGMFDYQVVEDCNILTKTLKGLGERKRKFSC